MGATIALVDDDRNILTSVTMALEAEGYAVRAYTDVLRYRELVDAATQNYAEHKQVTAHVEERAAGGVQK